MKNKKKDKYEYKHDKDKPRLDIVPSILVKAVGIIMTYGMKIYGKDNWKNVEKDRYKAALYRHWLEYLENPKSRDKESGYLHLWHVATNATFLIYLEGSGEDECRESEL